MRSKTLLVQLVLLCKICFDIYPKSQWTPDFQSGNPRSSEKSRLFFKREILLLLRRMMSYQYLFYNAVLVIGCSIFFFDLLVGITFAEWTSDPTVNLPICTAEDVQSSPEPVSDGANGTIIIWSDKRSGNDDIYAQRINANGKVLWTTDGVPICTAAGRQYVSHSVNDGAGGAIITWEDHRSVGSPDIYAQRINANGEVLWITDGVPICTVMNGQYSPQLVSDGTGGAIITWYDYRSGSSDIYAQRINANGEVLWTTDGVPICRAASSQYVSQPVSDGAGGAIITWEDYRSIGSPDIYVQRINANGEVLWTTDGVPICTAADKQWSPELVSDGADGAIITWIDMRSDILNDIYAQRVNPNGAVLWTTDGVSLCTAANEQLYPQLVSDGAGGAIITWQDKRGGNIDIYAQRVNPNGAALWTTDGMVISAATGEQWYPQLVSDDLGGAIITWQDKRSDILNDIYAQRVNPNGEVLWTTDGVSICTAINEQLYPQLVSNGPSGAIITWQDKRSGNDDIYAQNVNFDGTLGPQLKVGFALSLHEGINIISIPLKKNNWRLSDMAKHIGIDAVSIIIFYDYEEKKFPSYLPGITPENAKTNVPIQCGEGYIVIMKKAKEVSFEGQICTYEVNAAPSPMPLILFNNRQRKPIFVVTGFAIREEAGRFLDDVAVKIRNLRTGQMLQDVAGAWAGTGRYIVTFAASEEEFMTRAGDNLEITAQDANYRLTIVPVIHTLTTDEISDWVLVMPLRLSLPKQSVLLQNYPNPFNPETWLPYQLAQDANVTITIYNIKGQFVRTLHLGNQRAGVYVPKDRAAYWDGKDSLDQKVANGIYYYTLKAGNFTATRKMVILK